MNFIRFTNQTIDKKSESLYRNQVLDHILSQQEEEALAQLATSNPTRAAKLRKAAEDQLIEDYLQGKLTEDEDDRFELWSLQPANAPRVVNWQSPTPASTWAKWAIAAMLLIGVGAFSWRLYSNGQRTNKPDGKTPNPDSVIAGQILRNDPAPAPTPAGDASEARTPAGNAPKRRPQEPLGPMAYSGTGEARFETYPIHPSSYRERQVMGTAESSLCLLLFPTGNGEYETGAETARGVLRGFRYIQYTADCKESLGKAIVVLDNRPVSRNISGQQKKMAAVQLQPALGDDDEVVYLRHELAPELVADRRVTGDVKRRIQATEPGSMERTSLESVLDALSGKTRWKKPPGVLTDCIPPTRTDQVLPGGLYYLYDGGCPEADTEGSEAEVLTAENDLGSGKHKRYHLSGRLLAAHRLRTVRVPSYLKTTKLQAVEREWFRHLIGEQ